MFTNLSLDELWLLLRTAQRPKVAYIYQNRLILASVNSKQSEGLFDTRLNSVIGVYGRGIEKDDLQDDINAWYERFAS